MEPEKEVIKKDYGKWHELKKYIEENNKLLVFAEREVWWCSIGLNLGDEEDGKNEHLERPVVIFRKFNKHIFWGLPMSTKIKKDDFHYIYSFDDTFEASILLSQLRLMSSKRLIRKLVRVSEKTFTEIQSSVVNLISPAFVQPTSPKGELGDRMDENESDPTLVGSSGDLRQFVSLE